MAFPRAFDALAAAVEILRGLAGRPPTAAGPLRVRIGLHTGQPTLTPGGYLGLDVHRAARLGAAGHGGQIVLSQSTRELVEGDLPEGVSLRDLGEHRLKDVQRAERVYQVVIAGLPADFPSLRTLDSRPNNLPGQLTNFIGRERELAEAKRVLTQTRFLVLTGPGGTGKTRFAIHLAADLLEQYEDGVFFIDLAPVFHSDLVMASIAQTLGVPDVQGRPPLERLKDYLREKRLLLVLDNFEQVLVAGPQLVELLAACSMLTVLVTSRVALRVSGEKEVPVPPLSLPDPQQVSRAGDGLASLVGGYEAVHLFVERARSVQADFILNEENAQAVADICRRLDGLPLAIELAAARIRLLPPRAMLARLAAAAPTSVGTSDAVESSASRSVSPLQFLTGGARDLPARQQTLRAAIAWSYDLLDPSEQALFRRLAVFVGGCSLEAAEAAAGASAAGDRRWALTLDEVLDGVESLIAKNLLRAASGVSADEPRFTMLETIREYGLERLGESGELRSMRTWHAGYYLSLAEQAVPLFRGPEQRAWLDRLEAEHDNLRAALEWSLAEERGGEAALRLCGALAWFWQSRAYASEGRRWSGRALAGAPADSPARLSVLYGAGWLAHIQRDGEAARDLLESALALARELGDLWAAAWTLHLLGRVAYFDGDAQAARELGEQSLATAREVGDQYLIAWALHLIALSAHIADDFNTAWDFYERAVAIRRELGYLEGIGICHNLMGMVAYRRHDFAAAYSLLRDALRELGEVGAFWTANNTIAAYAALAAKLGHPAPAMRLVGATQAFGEQSHMTPIPLTETMLTEAHDLAARALNETEYGSALAAGRAMSLQEAIGEALALELQPSQETVESDIERTLPGGLTTRELEVLQLIALGRTSKEIAEALVISVPTVERHITHIYGKIGARGRAEATAFAVRHGMTA